MNRLDEALSHFRALAPTQPAAWQDFPSHKLAVWLRDDVSRVAEQLAGLPEFRQYATWSLTALRPGALSPERRLLDRVMAALAGVRRRIRAIDPSPPGPAPGRKPASDRPAPAVKRRQRGSLPSGLQDWVSSGAIPEPFDADDYFEPRPFFFSESVPFWELTVSLSPELPPAGDFVTRALLVRLDTVLGLVAERAKAVPAARRPHGGFGLAEVRRRVAQLRELCTAGFEGELRDASVTLVQVHAAFHPAHPYDWLPLGRRGPEDAYHLRHRVTHQHGVELVRRVAAAMESLRDLFAQRAAAPDSLARLIRQGHLVLVTGTQEAYWEGKRFPVSEKYPACWRLLLALAKRSKRSQAVTYDVLDEGRHPTSTKGTLYTTVSRLKALLPPSLKARLRGGRGAQYSLDLPRREIHVVPGGDSQPGL
jgi:hypothetical protein